MDEKSWGIRWHSGIQHAPDNMCKCQRESRRLWEMMELLVGFDTGGPMSQRSQPVVGVGVFMCDKCHELFWYHLDVPVVRFAKECTEKWNPGN